MIEVRNLTKRFGAFVAVDDVSFDVADGETFALLGPNGSGKTTTLKCLVGLTVPTAGRLRVGGHDAGADGRTARRLASYLPQRVSFHESLTAREVLEFYCRLRRLPPRRVDAVLNGSAFNFNGFGDKPVGEFSGGMVQRLGLAVACLPDAPILILDEPTISLDPDGAIRFREFLASLKRQGKTIVFSSHMLGEVEQLADRVAILVGGRLVALESVGALREGLMRSCTMRVVVRNPSSRLEEAARDAGAAAVARAGETLLITSGPAQCLTILRALETAGGQVASLATQDPSLEDIYLRYIGENAAGGAHR